MRPASLDSGFAAGEPLILDGGLATELEANGFDLNHVLWSARVLIEEPEAIRAVHARFLAAGADCIISATYQASFPGLAHYGLSDKESERLFRFAVELAAEERNRFWRDPANREGRRRPLVAASVGPYGAFLADGSEYTGAYAIDDAGLATFHWRRLEVLARAGADLLAVETIPSAREARVLRRLLERLDTAPPAWFSFTCRDGAHLSDGTPVGGNHGRSGRLLPDRHWVGVNCTGSAAYLAVPHPEIPRRQRQTGGRLSERRRPLGPRPEDLGNARRNGEPAAARSRVEASRSHPHRRLLPDPARRHPGHPGRARRAGRQRCE